jgi:hypothetical protein
MARMTTENLIESVMMDLWPRTAACCDFGIQSQRHYEALYYPIRAGIITPEQLDEALGDGKKLTALVNAHTSNPHVGIVFQTVWDELDAEEDDLGEPWGDA